MVFSSARERFARRLTNLSALLASHEMSLAQLKISRAQAFDLMDRFEEISTVLVPVWRQHAMAINTTAKNSPEILAIANNAHESLVKSLVAMNSK